MAKRITYACSAKLASGGRCPNDVEEIVPGKMCEGHVGAELPDYPDVISFHFWLAEYEAAPLEGVVERFIERNYAFSDKLNLERAEAAGVDPYEWREEPSSGVPVVELKKKSSNLSTLFVEDLIRGGFRPIDIHFATPRTRIEFMNDGEREIEQDRPVVKVLVVRMSHPEHIPPGYEGNMPNEIISFLILSNWRECRVWVNPPDHGRRDGRIIHAVNCQYQSGLSATYHLRYADGLWGI